MLVRVESASMVWAAAYAPESLAPLLHGLPILGPSCRAKEYGGDCYLGLAIDQSILVEKCLGQWLYHCKYNTSVASFAPSDCDGFLDETTPNHRTLRVRVHHRQATDRNVESITKFLS